MSEEFSKVVSDNNEYLITASLTTDIINNIDVDGIIYPSVQLSGQAGLNIALSPKAADNKLRFIRTVGQALYKNRDKSIIRIEYANNENGQVIPHLNIPDEYILQKLNIRHLDDLPLVK